MRAPSEKISTERSRAVLRDGDYLVVTAPSPEEGAQEVLFVMDGKTAPPGTVPVSLNADRSGDDRFHVYYFPAASNTQGTVTLANFRTVKVE